MGQYGDDWRDWYASNTTCRVFALSNVLRAKKCLVLRVMRGSSESLNGGGVVSMGVPRGIAEVV